MRPSLRLRDSAVDFGRRTAGEVVEVAWTHKAWHGGGYQYRLCPADHTFHSETLRIDNARDQTFGRTCASAPGSALCGERLSKEFIGPPMEQVGSPLHAPS